MREVFIDIASNLRIRFTRTEAPPPVTYAITLETERQGAWQTIRLWDNADDPQVHHEHRYTRRDGKQAPIIHPFSTINEAMAKAITDAKLNAEKILAQWEKTL